MSNQKNATVNAAEQQTILGKVNLFLFDLKNEAKERGFKPHDSWILELATDNDLRLLRRSHHPIILMKLQPTILLRVYLQIKSKLNQAHSDTDLALTNKDITNNEQQYLVAYAVKNIVKIPASVR